MKRRRRFRRKYLQPQPKRIRRRADDSNDLVTPEGWNGVIKNISGIPVSETEEKRFLRCKKFCPVDLDPVIIRIQQQLNQFYRQTRSELERKWNPKKEWKYNLRDSRKWKPPR